MSFWDLFFLFSLYTIGFYHLVVGWVGIISTSALVYPMPFTLNRPSLYLMILWIVFLNQVEEVVGPIVTNVVGLLLLADIAFETVRPLIAPVITVIGSNPEAINLAVREALSELSLPFKAAGPTYVVREPFAKLKVRFREGFGTAEIRIKPYRRKRLLEDISNRVAQRLDSVAQESRGARGYVEFVIVGFVLIGVVFWRLAVLLA
jgi:hypothetical protein